jgi:hypothetical protein
MQDPATSTVSAFSKALDSISPSRTDSQRATRRLLSKDPLEQIIPGKLLEEGTGRLLTDQPLPDNPVVLFMDRGGGKEGTKTAQRLIPLIGKHCSNSSFIHVAFSTPARGIGTLIRNTLLKTGAEHGVSVYVAAADRPFRGLKISGRNADELTEHCTLAISFAPSGSAGLVRPETPGLEDHLLRQSHLSVLSYQDPESVVAELTTFERTIQDEQTIDGIRFWVQVEQNGTFEDLGVTDLGPGGHAKARLWALIDNARRQRYRVLVEPRQGGLPAGDPLVCPCQTVIERTVGQMASVERIVPAGATLVALARGQKTLT